jgi:triacylglycerol esterase/lipase EstA (alpha/beta hydrolase family)
MLARLLRWIYLIQLLVGGLIGSWVALQLAPRWGDAALGLIGVGALVWVIFWQAVAIGSSMLLSRPPGPLAPWLKAAWGELRAALLIFGLRLPWTRGNPGVLPSTGTAKPGQTTLPVLLVHGFVCNHRVWDTVAPRLRAQGHSVLALDLEPLFTSIDDYAPLIDNAVTRLCTQTGSDQVVLVGHSMGGLAIRAWLRAYGATRAAKVITLGTPHQGTQAPQWVSTPNGEQMAWGSRWLSELAQSETPTTRQRMSLALTQHDNIVFPQREQHLVGAQVTEFSAIGHLQMCLDDGVIGWLLGEVAAIHPQEIR